MTMYNYNVYNQITKELQPVIGSKIQEYKGIKFFVAKSIDDNSQYVCVELTTSLTIGGCGNTAKKAIDKMKANLEFINDEKLQDAIESCTKLIQSKGIETPINTCEPSKAVKYD